MFIVGIATLACGLATNFETLMVLRIVAGMTAGGILPIAFAVASDRVPEIAQRQVAFGKLLLRPSAAICWAHRLPASWGI